MGPFDAVELKRRADDAAGGAGEPGLAHPDGAAERHANGPDGAGPDGAGPEGAPPDRPSPDGAGRDGHGADGAGLPAVDASVPGLPVDAPAGSRIAGTDGPVAADGHAPDGIVVEEISGTVKWFDATKGYGFVIPDDGGADVLVHVTCLRRDGFPAAAEGARVVCQVVRRAKGRQAHRVLSLDLSTAVHPVAPVPRTRDVIVPGESFERATVKWFNRLRGFGFLTTGPGTPDIFVHMEILRRGGLGELRPGQVVYVRFGDSSKGRIAAEVKGDPASGDAD